MGYQIIRQPDTNLFAVFSSYTDTIVVWDATAAEVVDWFVEIDAERTRRQVTEALTHIGEGNPQKVYARRAMTWEQALDRDRDRGGTAHAELAATDAAARSRRRQ